jgi:hypothetical protein
LAAAAFDQAAPDEPSQILTQAAAAGMDFEMFGDRLARRRPKLLGSWAAPILSGRISRPAHSGRELARD